ncbi:MAG: YbaN family protein [Planctomycetota bacterium]
MTNGLATTADQGVGFSLTQLAEGLLADTALRSVTIDRDQRRATLRYRDRRVTRAVLTDLADQYLSDSARLGETTMRPPVECWPDAESGAASFVRAPEQAVGWRRAMHLGLAALWFTLAVLGAILPGLPCTGFLILTSYSLCRSSTQLHNKLLNSRWFGPTLRHWRVHRGVRPGIKTKALSTLLLMVGCSLAFAPLPAVAWWAVAVAGVIGAVCIARLRVIDSQV